MTEYDRAAARGTGAVKAGGNYAADVLPSAEAKEAGYPIALYLDSVEHKYVEEFSTSNFIAIDSDGNYVTPASESILQSVTNMSLRQIARDLGMGVEERAVPSGWEVARMQDGRVYRATGGGGGDARGERAERLHPQPSEGTLCTMLTTIRKPHRQYFF